MKAAAPQQILTADQMRASEQRLIDQGETVESLMERAGAGAADWVWRLSAGRPVTVLCGSGNNGGDGYVIARLLEQRGVAVSVVAPMGPKTDAAVTARKRWAGTPVDFASGEVFVDCLFGTGLARPLSDDLLAKLTQLSDAHALSVAIDLPSGVDSDTGECLNDELPHYALTVALGAWKRAHWLMPACAAMGSRHLFDIGVGAVENAVQLTQRPCLSAPARDAHKYSRGLVTIIGGEMPGAAILAAKAAQHAGAGYVKLLAPHSHPDLPADIVLDENEDMSPALDDKRLGALLIGPGLGRSEKARQKLRQALASSAPLVLDADALTLLSPDMLGDGAAAHLATPHEGELASLCEAFGISANGKLEEARALHEATGLTVLAKGSDNILVGSSGIRFFPPTSPWLSTAGTGDVLAGIAASRVASGCTPFLAAQQAVQIHAEAARIAGPVFSASDLVDALPRAYAAFL
ncbi:NAD(P)H-hydrate dehydratase [Aurantiacibacter rhizosphaerae]|uniref:Bifunctional NAD(P)H-hydrate repair enzyme n=1 Tax=Aurantiacibacter rhizosphaerae TaxID=2691582 RepID=A0A844XE52_9SPHN|nr:NAD(P)H-hydrate dehydratase [Aurantiacibacter rhizosphaerae]MWV27858.1 NAD(P)H-hydrate dehydratase [Aurantiacibacter rhizosphaerae]